MSTNEPRLAFCAIEIGSFSFRVCVFTSDGFQIVLNEASERDSASLVAYEESGRLVGESAQAKRVKNVLSTIESPARLIACKGERLKEEEKFLLPLHYDRELNAIALKYFKIAPEQTIMAIITRCQYLLSRNNFRAFEVSLVVPNNSCHSYRLSLLECAKAVFSNNVKVVLVNSSICLLFEYVYFVRKARLEVEDELLVVVDFGHTSTTINAFSIQSPPVVVDHQNLPFTGIRNLDELVVNHYLQIWNQINPQTPLILPKSLLKLRYAVRAQRRVLSANYYHQLSIDCLVNDIDFTPKALSRMNYYAIVMSVLSDIATSLTSLWLRIACKGQNKRVEITGGGSYIPCLQKLVESVTGERFGIRINALEGIVRGGVTYMVVRSGTIVSSNLSRYRMLSSDLKLEIRPVLGLSQTTIGSLLRHNTPLDYMTLITKYTKLPLQTAIRIPQANYSYFYLLYNSEPIYRISLPTFSTNQRPYITIKMTLTINYTVTIDYFNPEFEIRSINGDNKYYNSKANIIHIKTVPEIPTPDQWRYFKRIYNEITQKYYKKKHLAEWCNKLYSKYYLLEYAGKISKDIKVIAENGYLIVTMTEYQLLRLEAAIKYVEKLSEYGTTTKYSNSVLGTNMADRFVDINI